MVHVQSFSGNAGAVRQHFLKKDVPFRPAGGEMLCQVSDHVSFINYRRYAVGSKPGMCLDA
jgi:hypothetical protein